MRSEEILGREDAKIIDRGVTAVACMWDPNSFYAPADLGSSLAYSTFLNDLV